MRLGGLIAWLTLVWAVVCVPISAAHAHATLIASEPAEGATVATTPPQVALIFNEPVSALVLRLVGPDGGTALLANPEGRHERLEIRIPTPLEHGTHALSWRVISLDGHPVGGTVVFSVGAPSSRPPPMAAQANAVVVAMIWVTKIVFYVGLFVGIGGSFFEAWIARRPACRPLLVTASIAGLIAATFAIGLQGLDALGVSMPQIASAPVWRAGFATSFGVTAILAVCAFGATLLGMATPSALARRAAALAAMVALGLSLAASGHASAAAPELLTRPAVFVHALAVAFWIGALAPLGIAMRDDTAAPILERFSRSIPWAVGALVLSGLPLAAVQVQHPSVLATSAYGRILVAKLVLVIVLLALAAWNRRCATPAVLAGSSRARQHLRRSIAAELILVLGIFALVASWRFTPPPRALAAAAERPAVVHIHTAEAMADVKFEPGHAGVVRVSVALLTGDFGPLDAQEVRIAIENRSAGLEEISRPMVRSDEAVWRVEQFPVPRRGHWDIRLDILINDFEKIILQGKIDIRDSKVGSEDGSTAGKLSDRPD